MTQWFSIVSNGISRVIKLLILNSLYANTLISLNNDIKFCNDPLMLLNTRYFSYNVTCIAAELFSQLVQYLLHMHSMTQYSYWLRWSHWPIAIYNTFGHACAAEISSRWYVTIRSQLKNAWYQWWVKWGFTQATVSWFLHLFVHNMSLIVILAMIIISIPEKKTAW